MKPLKKIAVVTKPVGALCNEVERIIAILRKENIDVLLDENSARCLKEEAYRVLPLEDLAQSCDAVITLGGDGTMIGAARVFGRYAVPVIGVCAGRLGFITDIPLGNVESILPPILRGRHVTDTRPLLEGTIYREGKEVFRSLCANDVGICHGRALGMVEYTVSVDDEQLAVQRADGIIVSTATGSTAYAMSAGGPIMHPSVDSMLLVPIAPHTLSNRPIVLHSSSAVKIEVNETRSAVASFDAQVFFDVVAGDMLSVRVSPNAKFIMLHPEGFNHFDLLRRKLHWNYLPRAEEPMHEPEG